MGVPNVQEFRHTRNDSYLRPREAHYENSLYSEGTEETVI
jgi:hypothetical protein